ncbi:metal ABC transporter ATP-binding protein [Reichenbachiella agariperforans]|uniref:Manganese/zinc/iron transport system ATP-binding protein n=1 Tax=Reichenbachiella agariperforans TaxID=156994 RepID=A0A1M6J5H4_REIAG|nr:ABC transporter ATP-binding protein [Reichenbachiella agariperforans]MBU2913068.1 ABC transporter ATP-binding protein [Reichenbachiella agariperforans]SHJ41897.1 manganese/zinc/iron transport system ATP-binding protein [Reichenbachiella agariperforans]
MIVNVENPILEVHDLTVTYSRKPVLWGVDMTLPKGSLVGVIGPNGAGKSTLIKAIMGLIPLSSGWVELFGSPLDDVRKKVSYVPQKESVDWDFPASVRDVVVMGRYAKVGLFKRPRKADYEAADYAIAQVKMTEFANRQISQLSGGQQQRVFLARALAQNADLYFMDEPFAGVDAATEKAIIGILKQMSAQGKTVIVVHHDLQTVTKYFDWVVQLNTRLVASGPVEEVFTQELLQETYGGKLTILSDVGNLLRKQGFPTRDVT